MTTHGSILFPIGHMAAFDAAEGKKMLVSTKIEYIGEKLEYCCVCVVFFVAQSFL